MGSLPNRGISRPGIQHVNVPDRCPRALAAVTLMHEQAGLRIAVMRACVPVRRSGRAWW